MNLFTGSAADGVAKGRPQPLFETARVFYVLAFKDGLCPFDTLLVFIKTRDEYGPQFVFCFFIEPEGAFNGITGLIQNTSQQVSMDGAGGAPPAVEWVCSDC